MIAGRKPGEIAESQILMPKEESSPSAEKKSFRSGFVAIVGRPNAGKSTLINKLVGQKVAIVTSKPQTTRNRIQGIVTKPQGQIVFIDTPGLHAADSALGRQMMQEVAAAVEGIDVLLLVVDATVGITEVDAAVSKVLQRSGRPVVDRSRCHADHTRCQLRGTSKS